MKRIAILLTACLCLSFAACTVPPKKRVVWPVPPAKPRVEFQGTFASQNTFDKTGMDIFWEKILGPQPAEGFRMPTAIASSGDGLVYVADAVMRNVRVFDFNKKHIHLLTRIPMMGRPMGLDYVDPGYLYVADTMLKEVGVYDVKEGKKIRSIGRGDDLLSNPVKVKVNKGLGRVYVSDSALNKVLVFDLEGNKLFDFGTPGSGEGELNSPQGMAFDSEDNLYVAEQMNCRVQVFDADGNYLRMFGERGDREWQMEMPRDVAIDRDGHLYLADVKKAAVLVFNTEGEYGSFLGVGRRSTSPFGFTNPTGVYVDDNQTIYISDSGARRFTVWQYLTDEYLEKNPLPPEFQVAE